MTPSFPTRRTSELEREIIRRTELQREACQRRSEKGDQHLAEATRDERTNGRNGKRRTSAAFSCHLIAIDTCDDVRRLSRPVDENGCVGATIGGAVVDALQHVQPTLRWQAEGPRQQDAKDHRPPTTWKQHN